MYVFVLESLKDSDPKTGKAVHKFLVRQGIASEFFRFTSKAELLGLLEDIKIQAVNNGLKPFVHFDCHGNNDGIAVINKGKSGELVTWREILDEFIAIYRASNQGSVICMSSCYGMNISKMVACGKACPFDQISGSLKKVPFNLSLEAYKVFYKGVAEGREVFEVAVGIHNDPEFSELEFLSANRDSLWQMTVAGYERDQLIPSVLAERKAGILSKLLSEFPEPTFEQQDFLEKAFSIEGQLLILKEYERRFFSLD